MHMKKLHILLSSLVLSIAVAVTASAQTTVRLATVDMGRVFENYERVAEAQRRLQSAVEQAQAQAQRMMEEGQALVEDYRRVLEEANNPALSQEARQQLETRAEEKLQTIREREREVQQFQQNTQRSLQQQQINHRQLMMDEIRQVVASIAQERGLNVVLDSTANVAQGQSPVLFAAPEFDLTEQVLQQLNRNRPAAGGNR